MTTETAIPLPASQSGFVSRMARLSAGYRALGRWRLLVALFLVMMIYCLALRLILLGVYVGFFHLTMGEFLRVVAAGAQVDALIALLSVVPQALMLALPSDRFIAGRRLRLLMEIGWSVTLALMPLLCISEILFFEEFDSRLNYIAFEYLVYPTEVCCNIQQSYPLGFLFTVVFALGGGACLTLRRRFHGYLTSATSRSARWATPVAMTGLLVLLAVNTRVTTAEVSKNRVAVQCAMNGVYSFAYHAWTCRFEFDRLYMTLPKPEATARIRRRVAQPHEKLDERSTNPLDRDIKQPPLVRPYNVVLILEESLGSDYVGVLGGRPGLTPNLDALARDNLLLDHAYATGNRTARALEAVLTSLPPIPTESILKRDKSSHVFTLATVLAHRGYERLFITGGSGEFDGVRDFMTANGFNRFLEQDDIPDPSFTNAWGVADEDLFRRGLQEMDEMARTETPFLSVLLTVSNHRPFTYPDGRIDLPSSEQTRDHAVKYADWALGEFFRQARTRAWCSKTLFVVMGDHGARVYGEQQFPMKSYRIPVVIQFPEGQGERGRLSTLCCSLDIAPTIMGVLGGDYASVFFGRDVRALPPEEGYALMQHNHDVALLTADHRMAVLGTGRRAWEFQLDPRTFQLTPQKMPGRDLVQDAIALYQSAYQLYDSEQYNPRVRDLAEAKRPVGELSGTSGGKTASHVPSWRVLGQ